MNNIENAKPIT